MLCTMYVIIEGEYSSIKENILIKLNEFCVKVDAYELYTLKKKTFFYM